MGVALARFVCHVARVNVMDVCIEMVGGAEVRDYCNRDYEITKMRSNPEVS
jgi:hypothetical protein